jgi:hypothetical protein
MMALVGNLGEAGSERYLPASRKKNYYTAGIKLGRV